MKRFVSRDMQARSGHLLVGLILVLVLSLSLAGCAEESGEEPEAEPTTEMEEEVDEEREEEPQADPEEEPATTAATLYFSDAEAVYLEPETRQLQVSCGEELPQAVVRALVAGSETGLEDTIPPGTRVRSVAVEDGVATVDLSREFRDNHWGGATGEMMTIYSLVNSLAELDNVERVQILLEGEAEEALLGHLATGEPLKPDWELVE